MVSGLWKWRFGDLRRILGFECEFRILHGFILGVEFNDVTNSFGYTIHWIILYGDHTRDILFLKISQ